jgi:L-alanine-DL-glutamate epimerase-like enolase superfamily enzyme
MIAKTQEEQIEKFSSLRKLLKEKGIDVGLIADEWCNTLADIRLFAAAGAADFVQIKTPDLGSIHNTIEAVLYCKARGMGINAHLLPHGSRVPAGLHALQARARRGRSADDSDERDGKDARDFANSSARRVALGRQRWQKSEIKDGRSQK